MSRSGAREGRSTAGTGTKAPQVPAPPGSSPGAVQLAAAEDARGQRLDAWLARELPALSRSRLQALIEDGRVLVDGSPARPSVRMRPGQAVRVDVPAPVPAEPQPEDIPLSVAHEDAHLLVVNKPAGLVVHPGAGNARGTLVNALLRHVKDLSGVGGVVRPGIVHRLDRGTSGLLVVAKDDETHRSLVRQFAGRTVEKEYVALVLGSPARASGEIDSPIGRDPVHRKKMSVRAPRGREARTSWRVVERFDGSALLRVRIHTGRTHQIRVHLASIGHPVAGDAVYGGARALPSRRAAAREAYASLDRPALHAARLSFTHPATGERLSFEAPLPPDVEAVLALLRVAARV
jgi:23S rRNA pseudouridine1911/1915/1917 synthase